MGKGEGEVKNKQKKEEEDCDRETKSLRESFHQGSKKNENRENITICRVVRVFARARFGMHLR